jgi:dolichyl-phosphate beta-glucosyltransferase
MYRSTIVVPCYNEAERFCSETFLRFAKKNPQISFLLVNDGSTDKTADILDATARRNPGQIRSLHLPSNCGKAEAVRQGVVDALNTGPDYVGFWDADLATPLEEIPRFAAVLNTRADIDLVIGSRIPLLGRKIERKLMRRLAGRLFANVASSALGLAVYDTQCGAKLFRATGEVRNAFAECFAVRWIFDVEIFARCLRMRKQHKEQKLSESIYEVSLQEWTDVAGSKLKSTDFIKAFFELANIYLKYLRPGAATYSSNLPYQEQTQQRHAA